VVDVADSREERLARNEAFFRDINERIREAVGTQGADGHVYEFICECSDPACVERVSMTTAEYERIRSEGNRFVLAVGHDMASIEDVVAANADHVVVEKVGTAGAVAQSLDPRPA
jgi:hypothetical protein